jgi:CubicO group peptidase (beta-lactamase class C family)
VAMATPAMFVPSDIDPSTTDDNLQQQFTAGRRGRIHPDLLVQGADSADMVLYRMEEVGDWKATLHQTAKELETAACTASKNGLLPLSLSSGGGKFGLVVAEHPATLPRELTIKGKAVPALAAIDAAMTAEMKRSGARAGSIAISRQGKLIYARAFTWAESGYPISVPETTFRIASMTKPITAVTTMQLIEENKLSLDANVVEQLSLQGLSDLRWNQITVDELLSHTGGWDRDTAGDPMSEDAVIATALGLHLPITKYDVKTFMLTQPLQFDPGTSWAYSNFGVNLDGDILETIEHKPYAEIVHKQIFKPLGITRARIGKSLKSRENEAAYNTSLLTYSVFSDTPAWCSDPLGALNIENESSNGAWTMAAADYVKFLSSFDAASTVPLLGASARQTMFTSPTAASAAAGYTHGWGVWSDGVHQFFGHDGALYGLESGGVHRDDDLSVVMFFNDNHAEPFGQVYADVFAGLDAVTAWPKGDQFPALGLPSY